MLTALLIGIPLAGAALALAIRADGARRVLLIGAAAGHAALTGLVCARRPGPIAGGWLGAGDLECLFLAITSALFVAAAVYAVGYLRREGATTHADIEEGMLFRNAPEAVFTACLLLFLGAMTLTILSRHLGLLWVAMEATTLASAPLIFFHRHHRSLEATWKYLVVCSVGIALALLGNFFVVVAAEGAGPLAMTFPALTARAAALQPVWLKAAMALMVVGYGTKMGLAPLHTWLPDAHSESPSLVSALLSGALLNCAFLAILRMTGVCVAAGLGGFAREMLIALGLVSMGLAATFIIAQPDYKRLLAYSSVEHMGILSLGVGLGGVAAGGALFHAVNHSLVKAALFLAAGNLLAAYRTKQAAQTRGALRLAPWTGFVWIAGFLAITGAPPFGTFVSELTILRGAVEGGHVAVAAVYLLLLSVIFVAMAAQVLPMAWGEAPETAPGADGDSRPAEAASAILPSLALLAVALALGCWIPGWLAGTLRGAAQTVGGLWP